MDYKINYSVSKGTSVKAGTVTLHGRKEVSAVEITFDYGNRVNVAVVNTDQARELIKQLQEALDEVYLNEKNGKIQARR